MRAIQVSLALLAAVSLLGCGATVTNKAPLFPTVSGSVDLKWNATVAGVSEVEFFLDDRALGRDVTPADGFTVELDTSALTNGLHVLRIVPKSASGDLLAPIEHTIHVVN